MFTALLFVGGVLLLLLTRFVCEAVTITRRSEILTENEPMGSYKGNWLLWQMLKWPFMFLFGYLNWYQPPVPVLNRLMKRRFELVGKENLIAAERMGRENGVFFLLDHRSSADVFVPQLIMYLTGFKRIAEQLFAYVIGLKFFNRHLLFSIAIRCRDRMPIVPDNMRIEVPGSLLPEEQERFKREQQSIRLRIFNAANRETASFLKAGRWIYLAPEGTRSRQITMIDVSKAIYLLLNKPGVVILPVATEGTETWWPVDIQWWQLWKMRPWNPIKMMVGEPVMIDALKLEAKAWAEKYGISDKQAFVDLIMYRIAALHQNWGDPWYMGVWAQPPEERYGSKKTEEEALAV